MPYRLLADLVVLLHFAFVLFVVLGGLLALRWRRALWVHLPSVIWAVWVECAGETCPLTPLENRLRALGGETGYAGGFIEQYLMPVLYPAGLTRTIQTLLGALALAVNLIVYAFVYRSQPRRPVPNSIAPENPFQPEKKSRT